MNEADVRRIAREEISRKLMSFPHAIKQHGFSHSKEGIDPLRWDALKEVTVYGTLEIPTYAQDTEPTIADGSVALWHDTTVGAEHMWFIWRFGEIQRLVEIGQESFW